MLMIASMNGSKNIPQSRELRAWRPDVLELKSDFALVPDSENADFVGGNHKSVQRDVTGMTVGNNQLAQFAFDPASYQWMRGKVVDRRLDCRDCVLCGIRIFVA